MPGSEAEAAGLLDSYVTAAREREEAAAREAAIAQPEIPALHGKRKILSARLRANVPSWVL